MTDNIISFSDRLKRLPPQSTELQKAVLDAVSKSTGPDRPEGLSIEDTFLARLWTSGFKVVPVDDDSKLSISDQDVIIDPSVPDGMILVKDARVKNIVVAMLFGGGP